MADGVPRSLDWVVAEFGDLVRPEVAVRKARAMDGRSKHDLSVDELVTLGRRCAMRTELHVIGAIRQPNGEYVLLEPQLPRPKQSHCKRGHPVNDANTYRSPSGLRVCRACSRYRWAEKRAARARRPS